MDEIKPIVDAIARHYPWVTAALMWIGAARVLLKFFNRWLRERLVDALGHLDQASVHRIVSSRWYQTLSFFVDLTCSVKLPREEDIKPNATNPN